MKKSVKVYAIVILLVTHFICFVIGMRFRPKPIVVVEEINNQIVNNKIGEKEAIIEIHKLPADSISNLLNNYYKKQ